MSALVPLLDELRRVLDGSPVETQFHNPYRTAAAEAALWRGEPDAALASIMEGLRETEGRERPRYQLRLFRTGMRAAADVAEVARARRDGEAEAAAMRSGDGLWAALQPVIDSDVGRRDGLDSQENEAEIATIGAERARVMHEPAVAVWADAAERWRAVGNPYLVGVLRLAPGRGPAGGGRSRIGRRDTRRGAPRRDGPGCAPAHRRDRGPRSEVPHRPVHGEPAAGDRRRERSPHPRTTHSG